MSQFVLDASVALTWFFEDQATPYTLGALEALHEDGAVVPALWALELANGIAVHERRQSVDPSAVQEFLALVLRLPLDVDALSPAAVFESVLPLAREHRLSSYDATYLELARRRRLPLATIDDPLARAARRAKVAAFQP